MWIFYARLCFAVGWRARYGHDNGCGARLGVQNDKHSQWIVENDEKFLFVDQIDELFAINIRFNKSNNVFIKATLLMSNLPLLLFIFGNSLCPLLLHNYTQAHIITSFIWIWLRFSAWQIHRQIIRTDPLTTDCWLNNKYVQLLPILSTNS